MIGDCVEDSAGTNAGKGRRYGRASVGSVDERAEEGDKKPCAIKNELESDRWGTCRAETAKRTAWIQ